MLSHPQTTKHVVESKTPQSHSHLLISENLNSNNHLRTPALPTYIWTKDPSTVIQLSPNTSVTILAPGAFLELPTMYQSITSSTPPTTVDTVEESLSLHLLPFRTIVIVSENHRSSRLLPGPPGQGVVMMPSHLFNQGCHTPISLLPMTFCLRVHHCQRHSLLTRTNTSITTHPTNLRSATARGTIGHTRGRTIPWNEMSPTTMSPLPPTSTPYPFHLPGLRDLHPFKRRTFLAAPNEEFITIRGWALRRT